MEFQRIIRINTIIGISILYLSVCATSSTTPPTELPSNETEFTPIVGGQYAKPGQFPWMAVVYHLYWAGQFGNCGGSIISERWVLTAGHCVVGGPRRYLVVVGETDKRKIRGERYLGQGVAMITTKVVLHPQYHLTNNDIALLYMPQEIKFGQNINLIGLAGPSYAGDTFVGKRVLIVGWGLTGYSLSEDLKWGKVPILSQNQCSRYWYQANANHICTAPMTGTDACVGDSGGPLVIGTDRGSMQIGIVSFGDNRCPSSIPGVFTRVSSFIGWIQRVTSQQF